MFNKLQRKFYYWHFFLALLILKYAIFCYIELRQYLYISSPTVPADLQPYLAEDVYHRIRKLEMEHFVYGFFESFAHCAIFLLTFCFGFLAKGWSLFQRLCDRLCKSIESLDVVIGRSQPIAVFIRSILFYLLFVAIQTFIVYEILVIPRMMNWLTPSAPDNTKSFLTYWKLKRDSYDHSQEDVIIQIITGLLTHITMHRSYGFSILPIISFTLVYEAVKLIHSTAFMKHNVSAQFLQQLGPFLPLLNRFRFPLERVFTTNGMVNAFVSGIGPFSIMVIGTGLQTIMSMPEIIAVVGHELGHWVLNHLAYEVLLDYILLTVYLVIAIHFIRNRTFYRSFDIDIGPEETVPIGVGLVLAIGFHQLFRFYTEPLVNYIAHICEYQADAFSCSLGYGADLLNVIFKLRSAPGSRLGYPLHGLFTSRHPVFSSRIIGIIKATP